LRTYIFRNLFISLTFIALYYSCTSEEVKPKKPTIEAISLLGDTLYTPESNSGGALKNYEYSKSTYESDKNNADALIWYGRRAAYLGRFQEAINIYSEGIEKHPEDARFYRHRGHRYISTRQYEKAIADFTNAAELIKGTEDQVEPDGLPNNRNIPLSTLHGNIWYHLGLAYYLQNDMEKALEAYSNRTVTESIPTIWFLVDIGCI